MTSKKFAVSLCWCVWGREIMYKYRRVLCVCVCVLSNVQLCRCHHSYWNDKNREKNKQHLRNVYRHQSVTAKWKPKYRPMIFIWWQIICIIWNLTNFECIFWFGQITKWQNEQCLYYVPVCVCVCLSFNVVENARHDFLPMLIRAPFCVLQSTLFYRQCV